MNTLEAARQIIDALEDKKGEDIVLLDIHEIASFTDYFIICSGTSDRMLDSLADAVIEKAHETLDIKRKAEGQASSGWLVIDLDDIVVHLLSTDQRDYYRLEQLWDKGKVLLRLQ
ncbi:MAG TPA: ribosome silencing factor [Anaerolineaceae bacterium]|nr:ribosome silencing factor [Anaerolineaceae bacterium]